MLERRTRGTGGHGAGDDVVVRGGAGIAARQGDMRTTDGLPDMRMYGSASPATAAQLIAAGQLIKQAGASLAGFRPETAGHRSVT